MTISSLPQIVPTIIVGDFNHDLLSTPTSSRLLQLLSRGFSQLIKVPTTDSGSLLDHIYYNTASQDAHIDVVDTYYSDHDAAYIFLITYPCT
jgi:endonuclease/exonuclease/phosphatase family metal-dependent hydrolase